MAKIKARKISGTIVTFDPYKNYKAVRAPLDSFNYTSRSPEGWVYPEYDLADPYRIEDTESIFRQSIEKKTTLAFKHGYEFTGKNKRYLKYIKARLAQIAYATGIPSILLVRGIFRDLATANNAFLIKVRDKNKSGGRVRKQGNKQLNPVAGYFIAHPSCMQPFIKNKRIVKWRYTLPSGRYVEFNPEDVIHFHSSKRAGFFFAPPLVVPVKDDIRALRKIEENIELMLYQYLFPLFHYRIGTDEYPAGVTESGDDEITVAQQQLYRMTAEGGIVTSHRHEIRLLGIEGRQMQAESYLKHFLRRVLGGLGLSEIDLGISDSANRSTAESFSRSLVDAVKDLQLVIKQVFETEVVMELLLESGMIRNPMDLFDEDNMIFMDWHEIDIDYLVKIQNHNLDVFLKNGITYSELRQCLGKDPIKKGSKEEADLQWSWFELPSLLIRAVDEPYLELLSARTEGIDINEEDVSQARKYKEKLIKLGKAQPSSAAKKPPASKSKTNISAKVKPTNQHGSAVPVKPGKDALVRDSAVVPGTITKYANKNLLKDDYKRTRRVISDFIRAQDGKFNDRDMGYIKQLLNHEKEKTLKKIRAMCYRAYREGKGGTKLPLVAIDYIDSRTERYMKRFYNSLYSNISKAIVDSVKPDVKISPDAAVANRFDALEFRIEAMGHVEPKKAYALGKAHRWLIDHGFIDSSNPVVWKKNKKTGKKELKLKIKNETPSKVVPVLTIEPGDSACDKCEFISENVIVTDPYDMYFGDLEKFAPFHPNCECKVVFELFDFGDIEGVATDGKKLESCVSQVKTKLSEKHQDWSAKKIKNSAWAICKSKGLK